MVYLGNDKLITLIIRSVHYFALLLKSTTPQVKMKDNPPRNTTDISLQMLVTVPNVLVHSIERKNLNE